MCELLGLDGKFIDNKSINNTTSKNNEMPYDEFLFTISGLSYYNLDPEYGWISDEEPKRPETIEDEKNLAEMIIIYLKHRYDTDLKRLSKLEYEILNHEDKITDLNEENKTLRDENMELMKYKKLYDTVMYVPIKLINVGKTVVKKFKSLFTKNK